MMRFFSKLIRAISPEISDILAHMFNVSIDTGIFPNGMKIERVVPIFKSEDNHKILNYRPISVLPATSKVFERLRYNRIVEF